MTRPIYILSLHNVRTGGPEAIHQLSDALIEQGFDARMVYYEWPQIYALEKLPVDDAYVFGARTNPIEEYAHYKVNITDAVPNSEDAIVVLPETLCHLVPKFPKATVLIWWLSVDNAFGSLARVNLNWLRRKNVRNLMQSSYADGFVSALKLAPSALLGDYTTGVEGVRPIPWADRQKLVVLNASHKVIYDLEAIRDAVLALAPDIECMLLRNLSRADAMALLARARVFVDMANFPGLDRLPREASCLGCAVLVELQGAGREYGASARYVNGRDIAETAREIVRQVNGFSRFTPVDPRQERDRFFRQAREIFSGL